MTDLTTRIGGLSPEKQALLARRLAARTTTAGTTAIARRGDDAPSPLSHAQELLWLYEQMTPGTPAYNVPIARRVRGPLDLSALQTAMDGVLARHESLRTSFVEIEGEARQLVHAPRPTSLELHDLRALAPSERTLETERLSAEIIARPFDLRTGTVPRVALIRLADDEAVLLVVAHHIVCDGTSIGVFLHDLALHYEAALAGREVEQAPLPIQIADHAVWERRVLDEARLRPSIDFWRDYLADAPAPVDLLSTGSMLMRDGGPAGKATVHLPRAFRDGVRRLSREQGATTFMTLLATFQAVVHRYSGENDLIFGCPVADRARPETQALIGHLTNTLLLRADLSADPTFIDLLAQVRAGALRAFEHRALPYERLARELHGATGATGAPLFNVVFVLQDGDAPTTSFGTATLEPVALEVKWTAFPLSISATEMADELRVVVDFRSDLFSPSFIEQLLDNWRVLTEAVIAEPARRVSQLPLLDPATRHRMIEEWNHTEDPPVPARTVHESILKRAAEAPGAIAVTFEGATLTYGELVDASARFAQKLVEDGAVEGEFVAVVLHRSIELVVALLGILMAGCAYVPIDPDDPDERIDFMLRDAAVSRVVTQRDLRERLLIDDVSIVLVDERGTPPAFDASALDRRVKPADAAALLFTSGSTGRPKGVMIPHSAIVNHAHWMCSAGDGGASDVILQRAPMTFDVAIWEIFGTLISGARIVLATPGGHRDTGYLVDVIARERVTILQGVPSIVWLLLDEPKLRECRTLRALWLGGEALTPDLVARLHALLPWVQLYNGYGPTETTIDATWWPIPSDHDPVMIPIGRAISHASAYVLSAALQPQPVGVPGELWIGGAGVALGYWNRPDLTAERFVKDPFRGGLSTMMYRTGDRVRWIEGGQLEFLGRLDGQIKLRGVRIEVGEVEAALRAIPAILAGVVVVRGPKGLERLVAYYTTRDGNECDAAELMSILATVLPTTFVPTAYVHLDVLPLTSSGKISHRSLPEPAVLTVGEPAIAPRNVVERVLAGVWSNVLGGTTVSVETSFFALGGHSLLATRIVSQISRIFRTQLPLRQFFECPTVAGVARLLEAAEARPGQAVVVARAYETIQQMTPEEREELRRNKAGIRQTAESQ